MATYEKSTRPLMDFYQKRGLLVTVMAGKVPDETFQRTMKMLNDVVAQLNKFAVTARRSPCRECAERRSRS